MKISIFFTMCFLNASIDAATKSAIVSRRFFIFYIINFLNKHFYTNSCQLFTDFVRFYSSLIVSLGNKLIFKFSNNSQSLTVKFFFVLAYDECDKTFVKIKSCNSSLVLAEEDNSVVGKEQDDGPTDQQWSLFPQPDGSFLIKNADNG